jgi:hypothetical protein
MAGADGAGSFGVTMQEAKAKAPEEAAMADEPQG